MVVVPRRLDVAMRLSNSKEPWTGGGCVGAHGVSRPRAQSLHFGTAPGPTHDCEAFDTVRSSAHDGLLACWEWCAEWGDDIDDEALWSPVNPAVATGRVPMQAVLDDLRCAAPGPPAQQSARHQMTAFERSTVHQLSEEPSPALLAVASPSASPSITARQPRSAQSCCATAPAATGRVEVVVLAVISILLFALSFRTFTGLFRRRTHCAAANGTCLSANRSAHGMNSTSSDWGTSGGQPVSGRLATIGI